MRRRGARLQLRRQPVVQRGDRQVHVHQLVARQVGEQVEVARDQRALGDDVHRVPRLAQHFQQPARDAVVALDRLPAVGVDAQRHRRGRVARPGQFLAQALDRIRLGEQPGFEIQPRRQVQVGVRGPREAVHAAVLAAAVGIDGAVEADVGRVLWLMMVRARSSLTVVCGARGRSSSSMPYTEPQPSSSPTRTCVWKRLAGREAAPRPLVACCALRASLGSVTCGRRSGLFGFGGAWRVIAGRLARCVSLTANDGDRSQNSRSTWIAAPGRRFDPRRAPW
jgi:hypothetical protein